MKSVKKFLALSMLLCIFSGFSGCERPSAPPAPSTRSNVKTAGSPSSPKEPVPLKDAAEKNTAGAPAELFQPFFVFSDKGSRQNHFIPSGFMPDGRCLSFNDRWKEDCYAGETCIQIKFDVACSQEHQGWAGIYWLNPANNWGQQKGGFNLAGALKLTFWAKGEKGGEQIQEFIVGGIQGDFPDSDKMVIGPVILGSEWRQYTVDLRGKDLSYMSGGFAWSTEAGVNPESCVFYLDEIKFE